MGDTTIRLSEAVKERLALHRRTDESYEDVIERLTGGEKWAGFGAVPDEDGEFRQSMAGIREGMRESMGEEVEGRPGLRPDDSDDPEAFDR